MIHVTISGVFGTWYYEFGNLPQNPTLPALKRALTTSFGSICLGSLLVAIVQLIRDVIENARRQQAGLLGYFIFACLSCFLCCIDYLIRLFNHFAFVQVALYNKSFVQAAKATFDLVRSSGLTALINMNLTSSAVALGELAGALIAGVTVGVAAYDIMVTEKQADESLTPDVKNVFYMAFVFTVLFAVLCAVLLTGMVSSTVTTGVTTVFVCWAEDPATLHRNNPSLHQQFESITSQYLLQLPYKEQEEIRRLGGPHAGRWQREGTPATPPAHDGRPQYRA